MDSLFLPQRDCVYWFPEGSVSILILMDSLFLQHVRVDEDGDYVSVSILILMDSLFLQSESGNCYTDKKAEVSILILMDSLFLPN